MRSGNVNPTIASNATSRYFGLNTFVWSRLVVDWSTVISGSDTGSTADYLGFNGAIAVGNSVYPSNTGQRFAGISLRCLSTAVEGESVTSQSHMQSSSPKPAVLLY